MEYSNKKVLIIGYGESGKACEKFLKKHKANVDVYDDRIPHRIDESLGYDFAVISPGVSSHHKLVMDLKQNAVPILSEPDLAVMASKSKNIIAVSGTNGKTTVSTILHDMLRRVKRTHLLGNVGTPFISVVERIRPNDYIVMEISSFQIEQSRLFRSRVATLTNVGEDHIDRHGSAKTYREIKLSLFNMADIGIKNLDDPAQKDILATYTYSCQDEKADFYLHDREIKGLFGSVKLPPVSRGEAFDMDYLCAYAGACIISKSGQRHFVKSYDSVKLPRFRNEYVGILAGGSVYNDSKGTNIDATLFALSVRKEKLALILGGSDKGEEYTRLMRSLGENIVRAYLVGDNAGDMYMAASDEVRSKCVLCSDLESCVADYVKRPCECLLFSPASASFDKYSGYAERGEVFDEIVKKYGGVLLRS